MLVLAWFVVVGLVATTGFTGATPPAAEDPPDARLVDPIGTGSHLWPYTSKDTSTQGRTLAINVVVIGDPATVRRALVDRSDVNWTRAPRDKELEVGDGSSPWQNASGAKRYTYVRPAGSDAGRWVASSYQLSTGRYLGSRVHVRAYQSPNANWTGIQAHEEYWDWYRLRHTVTGVPEAGRFVERDLRGEPFVDEIDRQYHGQGGGGGHGWLTVVQFASVVVVGSAFANERNVEPEDVAMPAAVVATVVGVRGTGLLVESHLGGVSPKVIAGVLYPVLVFAPVAALFLTRDRPATRTALLAGAALGFAVLHDMSTIGVRQVPVRLALHRVVLVTSFGVLAYAIAAEDRRLKAFGAISYLLVLVAPLVKFV